MAKTIKFKSVSTSRKFGRASKNCHGQILHNEVLKIDGMANEFAKSAGIGVHEARMYLSLFADYIVESLGQGKLLKFGDFELFLAMTGGIDGLNGRFDPAENAITANIRMREGLKEALAGLDPVNVTGAGGHVAISSVLDGRYKKEGVVGADEIVYVSGGMFLIDTEKDDEGVWLERDDGEKVARAAVLQSTSTTLDFRFGDPPSPGTYLLAVYSRMGNKALPSPAHARRKITVK